MSDIFLKLPESLRQIGPLLKKQAPFTIQGIHSSSVLSLLLSQEAFYDFNRPQLIVFPDHEALVEFQHSFHAFTKDRRLFELTAFDVGPFSGLYPNRKSISKRLQWLMAAGSAQKADIFLATAESLSQNTLPYDVFHKNQIHLKKGAQLPEDIDQSLAQMAYQVVPTVEDIGSYALRGGIFDIYSPAHSLPVRIELFGDTIESLRFFDPVSQRSQEEVGAIHLLPAREALFEKIPLENLIQKFNQSINEDLALGDEVSEIRRALAQKNYFFGIDFLLPLFYEKLSSPLDFFNEAPYVWFFQKDDLVRSADKFFADTRNFFEDSAASVIRPQPKDLYTKFDSLNWPDKDLFIDVERVELDRLENSNQIDIKSFALTEFTNQFQGLSHQAKEQLQFIKKRFTDWNNESYRISVACQSQNSAERLKLLFEKADIPSDILDRSELTDFFEANDSSFLVPIFIQHLPSGFRMPDEKIILLRDLDFWSKKERIKKRSSEKEFKDRADALSFGELRPGDFIVHRQHGIGIYDGLNVMEIDGVKAEFLQLRYKDNDRLYLPVYRVGQLQKYSGPSTSTLVDKLGGTSWAKTSGKVKSQVRDIASQLVKLYAKRAEATKTPFTEPDESYHQFENLFPYEETEDQLNAINDVLEGMCSDKPMDRLICGDVGFGKTEVALRAAFKAAEDGRQVAIIAPTTILSFQHYETFKKRFKNWPITVAALNRFVPAKEQKQILQKLKTGEIDIIIGTHRILSKDLVFKDLGLLIVDEEQKFGVAHKERLRQLREGIDTIAMSATPIPRTLNMSLIGIRDLSLINTPPEDRLPTRTFISRFDPKTIEKAMNSEIQRGGQVFFLHNRVQSIYGRADEIRKIIPNARIAVAHGQMKESELEDTMMQFFRHELDVLICTAIIESGMDIPRANTIFIDDAHMFGVSQLYQLRGRVGRSKERAYCYLLLPKNKKLDPDALERLRIIQENTALGSGIRVAQYDLELRGAGDLLGAEQSGHIKTVGYEMFMELLDEAIHELRGDTEKYSEVEPEINLRIPAFIPDSYIPDIRARLSYYKALSQITDPYELDTIEEELRDQFGQPPESVLNLMGLMLVRKDCKSLGVRDASAGNSWLTLAFTDKTKLPPHEVIRLTSHENKKYNITPDQRLKIRMKEITWPRVHEELLFLIGLLPK